jgi:threonine aldolase
MIELRSDVKTRPSAGMRAAMASAEVGDDHLGEDPTVNELERRGAVLLGQEACLFLPSATMANQIALRILSRPGEELIGEETSHVFISEQGGPAVHSQLVCRGLPGRLGRISGDQLRAAVRPDRPQYYPRSRVVVIENTHNSAGGTVWPLAELHDVIATARELGLSLHLDGSRIFNAAVALAVPAADLAGPFDLVTVCLSKGLGCPLGALLAGPAGLIADARRAKHLFGGATRQAGIVAAAGLYALDHNVARLADDHRRARRLGEALAAAGIPIDLARVETNFVQIDVEPFGLTGAEGVARLAAAGVGVTGTIFPTVLRAVTHLDLSDEDIEAAARLIPQALGVAGAVARG